MYSIIDIETTGGQKSGNKITEIAIINYNGSKVEETFSTLINPERSIPKAITYLTGITNEMVEDAPKFYEVAKKIVEMTEGRVFIAHNVFFDYNFIKREFFELGYTYSREKLCSVKLARKFLPGHKSYSLGKICADLNIKIEGRHRALGDATATLELIKLIQKNTNNELNLDQHTHKKALPPLLDKKEIDDLPNDTGVYYFYNKKNELLYVGKAKDISKRVKSHFLPDVTKKRELQFKAQIAKIKYKILGNELAALLFECNEIKNKRPLFNRSMKRKRFPYAIEIVEVRTGILDLVIKRNCFYENNQLTYSSKRAAENKINHIYRSIIGVNKDSIHFHKTRDNFVDKIGAKTFNSMIKKFYSKGILKTGEIAITLKGRYPKEKCSILINQQNPENIYFIDRETGEVSQDYQLNSDQDMKNILISFFNKHPELLANTKDFSTQN